MFVYFVIILCGIGLDQMSKYYAQTILSQTETFPVIQNVFHLTYTQNTGAAFSVLTDRQLLLILLTVVFTAVLTGILFLIPKIKKYRLLNLALALIISGAVGNLIDRIRLNYVIDFFDFRLIHFAIFNVADTFVVCGAFLLIFAVLTNRMPQNKAELNFIGADKKKD